jgi:hypothetical protein
MYQDRDSAGDRVTKCNSNIRLFVMPVPSATISPQRHGIENPLGVFWLIENPELKTVLT